MRRIFIPLEIRLTTAPVEIELEVERVRHLRYMRAIAKRKEEKEKQDRWLVLCQIKWLRR